MVSYELYAQARDAKGLNDHKISKATGISSSVFCDWKHGRYKPKIDKIYRIAQVLEVPLESLLEVGDSDG